MRRRNLFKFAGAGAVAAVLPSVGAVEVLSEPVETMVVSCTARKTGGVSVLSLNGHRFQLTDSWVRYSVEVPVAPTDFMITNGEAIHFQKDTYDGSAGAVTPQLMVHEFIEQA